jgi:hypothetical protein
MEFSRDIMESIGTLNQIYGTGKNIIRVIYPAIKISKYQKDREISVVLLYDSIDDTFELQEPVYRYYSKISYYDFKRPENRWTRNKEFLFTLIRNLKRCSLWEKISNKDFIGINEFNKEISSEYRLKILKEVQNKIPGIKKKDNVSLAKSSYRTKKCQKSLTKKS